MLLIAGASGFLGANTLLEAIETGRDVVGTFRGTPIRGHGVRAVAASLEKPGASSELLAAVRPEWVVNCVALADVDECDRQPALAHQINAGLPRMLAAACREAGVRLLHVSTDAVFDGCRGRYDESDEPSPLNVYARTKLEGERAVLEELPDAIVARTNFFGISPGEQAGLADWVVRKLGAGEGISGFTDVVFSPLVANDLARTLFAMMDERLSGLYHVGAASSASKFDFARMLSRNLGFGEALVRPAKLADTNLSAARPLNTSLSSARLEAALGRTMPTVEDSVALLGDLRRSGLVKRLNALIGK